MFEVDRRKRLLVIDSQTLAYQLWLASASADLAGDEILVLTATEDGVAQIARYLEASSTTYSAIYIYSHGRPGSLLLGSTALNQDNLASYSALLALIGRNLTETGNILLCGCDVALGAVGQAFIQSLAVITGADVVPKRKMISLVTNKFPSEDIHIHDSDSRTLVIQIRNPGLEVDESFDCVTLSARYDHGFGWSQLYRFVDDKYIKEIEKICDDSNRDVSPKLLPATVSEKWRVLVTPIIKTNEAQYADFYKQLMHDVIKQAQRISAARLLFSQYGTMMSYKTYHFDGIIFALNELTKGSFGSLKIIRFEIDRKYLRTVRQQFSNGLT